MAAPPRVNSCSTSSANCCCCCRSSKLRPIFDLLSNIQNLMPVKLESVGNFSAWRYQMDTVLRAYDLIGYVDGSLKCPGQFIVQNSAVRKMVNPAYEIWCREDRAVMAAINSTLSTLALRKVMDSSTARQLWLLLEQNYDIYRKTTKALQPDDYEYGYDCD